MSVLLILLLFLLTLILTAMTAAYLSLSTSHLRHWARKKDPAALKLYPLKARGSASYLTIEFLRAIALSGAIVMLTALLNPWAGWVISSLVLFLAFVVLTQLYLKPFGIRLLIWLSRPLLSLTHLLKPVTVPLGRVFDRFLDDEPVTVTRSQLSNMLETVALTDTDLSVDELRILQKVLSFTSKTIHDIMVPKRKAVSVKVSEVLSPIILDELHKSGHERFPVLGDDGKSVVGILNMHDLMDIKQHSTVAETMIEKVYFVDEDRDLEYVLQVFYKTKQSVFVVINTSSDMVGMISIEDIVQQILGKPNKEETTKIPSSDTSEELAPVVE